MVYTYSNSRLHKSTYGLPFLRLHAMTQVFTHLIILYFKRQTPITISFETRTVKGYSFCSWSYVDVINTKIHEITD